VWSKPYTHALDRMVYYYYYVQALLIYGPGGDRTPPAPPTLPTTTTTTTLYLSVVLLYIDSDWLYRRVCSIASGGCKNTKGWFGTYPPTTAYTIYCYYSCYYYNIIHYTVDRSPKSYKRRLAVCTKNLVCGVRSSDDDFFRFPFSYSVLIALSLLMQSYVIY